MSLRNRDCKVNYHFMEWTSKRKYYTILGRISLLCLWKVFQMKNTKRRIFLPVVVFLSIIGLGYFLGCKTEATFDLPQQKPLQEDTKQNFPSTPEKDDKTELTDTLEGAESNETKPASPSTTDDVESSVASPVAVTVAHKSEFYTEQTPVVSLPTISDGEILAMKQYNSPDLNLVKNNDDLKAAIKNLKYVTAVDDQGNYSTCWAYATAAALEAAILKRNPLQAETLDLSEVLLVYYRYNTVPTPIGGLDSDNREDFSPNIFRTGDFPENLINPLCAWAGVVNESTHSGINETNFDKIDRAKTYKDQVALVTSAGIITTNANYWPVDTSKVDEGVLKMKKYLYTYGALATAYNTTLSQPYGSDYEKYGSYYSGRSSKPVNHAVTIVGWDDDFNCWHDPDIISISPPKSGAWLVKNSYGDDFGNGGYFWLSYYDSTIASWAFYCDVASVEEYDNNYQYDSASDGDESIGGITSTILQTANVFTAQGNEDLKAVQFGMAYDNMKYQIDVYLNPDKNYPTSGEHMTSVQGSILPSGRHTVRLSTPIKLNKGDTFSVVVTYETEPNHTPTALYESTANSLVGQSFYRQGTSDNWRDMYHEGKGNLRLKAFTKNRAQ